MDDKTVKLLNLSTGETIALLSEVQLQALKEHLEEEATGDTDYYITPDTVEFLREQGASELADVLAKALSNADEVRVGYAPATATGSGRVRGRLLKLDGPTPLTGYKIEVYDEDLAVDDLLGWCYAGSQGNFELRFDESAFKDSSTMDIEGEPEVKLRIVDIDGEEVGWVGVVRAQQVDFRDIFVSATRKVIAPVLDPGAAAICPSCGVLYRAGFPTCSDCQLPVRPLRQ